MNKTIRIPRFAASEVRERLTEVPAVVLLGPRQIGKSTLAIRLAARWPSGGEYLDVEAPPDARRLADPYFYLRALPPRLGVIDEAQRMPELFPVLRAVIDENRRRGFEAGQFLVLGSAWLDLVMASTESLAGRVSLVELTGINVDEAASVGISEQALWVRGGFPSALLAPSDRVSFHWRTDLIRSYLERDVPLFGRRVPAETLRRLWVMLAHNSGGLLNASKLAQNLSISGPTVSSYLDLLVDLRLTRRLEPWFANVGKRVIKSPKMYVRDSGLLHALLELRTLGDVLGHPSVGASYESFVVECLITAASAYQAYFYRTARGAEDEVDLVLVRGGQPQVAIEVKLSSAPTVGAGFYRCCDDLGVKCRYLVHPDDGAVPYVQHGVTVIGLSQMVARLRGGVDAVEGAAQNGTRNGADNGTARG